MERMAALHTVALLLILLSSSGLARTNSDHEESFCDLSDASALTALHCLNSHNCDNLDDCASSLHLLIEKSHSCECNLDCEKLIETANQRYDECHKNSNELVSLENSDLEAKKKGKKQKCKKSIFVFTSDENPTNGSLSEAQVNNNLAFYFSELDEDTSLEDLDPEIASIIQPSLDEIEEQDKDDQVDSDLSSIETQQQKKKKKKASCKNCCVRNDAYLTSRRFRKIINKKRKQQQKKGKKGKKKGKKDKKKGTKKGKKKAGKKGKKKAEKKGKKKAEKKGKKNGGKKGKNQFTNLKELSDEEMHTYENAMNDILFEQLDNSHNLFELQDEEDCCPGTKNVYHTFRFL